MNVMEFLSNLPMFLFGTIGLHGIRNHGLVPSAKTSSYQTRTRTGNSVSLAGRNTLIRIMNLRLLLAKRLLSFEGERVIGGDYFIRSILSRFHFIPKSPMTCVRELAGSLAVSNPFNSLIGVKRMDKDDEEEDEDEEKEYGDIFWFYYQPQSMSQALPKSLLFTVKSPGHNQPINKIAFHPSGSIFAMACYSIHGRKVLSIFRISGDYLSASYTHDLKGHSDSVNAIAFHQNGRILASGSTDTTVCLWEISSDLKQFRNFAILPHRREVLCVAFHPEKYIMASGGLDNSIQLWRIPQGLTSDVSLLATLNGQSYVNNIIFHPNGQTIVSSSSDKTSMIWNLHSDETLVERVATLHGHTNRVLCSAISKDGTLLATGGMDNRIILWLFSSNCSSATPVKIIEKHTSYVHSVGFHGEMVVTAGNDDKVILWK